MKVSVLGIGVLISIAFATAARSDSGYHVLKSISISGDGNWDYVTADSINRRLYASHGTEIDVLNLDTGEIVGKIMAPQGSSGRNSMQTHGAAVAPDLGLGFTSDGGNSSSTIFDLKTLKTVAVLKLNGRPDGFLYDPYSKLAFLFSADTKNATLIDGSNRKIVGTIDLGGKPEEATSDEHGHLYIDIQDRDLVLKVDVKKMAVMESWSVAPLCHEPASMAIDVTNHRIFVGCRNQVMLMMNTNDGHVITEVSIGEVTDGAEFDPQARLIFSSSMDGTLNVIHEDSPNKYTVVDNVKTEFGARTMAFDPKTHRLFLILADRSNIPAPGTLSQNLRPVIVPGTFHVLVVGKQ